MPAGSVISQNPTAGTSVAAGSAVNLVVSTGPAPVTVPDVVGQTQAAATTAISGAGLVVGTVTPQSSATVPAGSVISQNPAAGTSVAPGSAVNLVVSLGPAPVSGAGRGGSDAGGGDHGDQGAGLTVGTVTQQYSATVPAGNVISQNPVSGTSVAPGSAVNLVVSLGVQPVTVPAVVGQTQAAASTAITGAGLTVGTVTQQYERDGAGGQRDQPEPGGWHERRAGVGGEPGGVAWSGESPASRDRSGSADQRHRANGEFADCLER